jgi:hypothetical protein
MALRERIDRDLRMTQSDRFYSVIYAVGMAGGYIGRDLGLFDINVDRVYDRALAALNDIRSDVLAPLSNTAMVAQETLMAYINENVNNVLVINARCGCAMSPTRRSYGYRHQTCASSSPSGRWIWLPP